MSGSFNKRCGRTMKMNFVVDIVVAVAILVQHFSHMPVIVCNHVHNIVNVVDKIKR